MGSKKKLRWGTEEMRRGRGKDAEGEVTQQLRMPTLQSMHRNPAGRSVHGLSTRQPGGIKMLTSVVLGCQHVSIMISNAS